VIDPPNDPAPRRTVTPRAKVLDHLSLRVDWGEVIAIVGQNGCGKSTLMNLLPRFYDVDSGEILIDGIPVKQVALDTLRSQIAIVTQDTLLFDGSVFENIAYGLPVISQLDVSNVGAVCALNRTADEIEQSIMDAAEQAGVMQFVDRLPDGIHSRIGEKGKNLSGGQRQRIALARAMVRDPAILILDEATSAADNESADLIHQALKVFSQGRTVLLITHSMTPSLLEFVTRVVVIEEGSVEATGQHDELIESCPLYRRLFHAGDTSETAAA